jgi:hypothetical protein
MAGSRKVPLNSAVKAAMKADTKEEIDGVIRRIDQRALQSRRQSQRSTPKPGKARPTGATGDDHRLALLKAGNWRIIEKTIRELADPPKSNLATN